VEQSGTLWDTQSANQSTSAVVKKSNKAKRWNHLEHDGTHSAGLKPREKGKAFSEAEPSTKRIGTWILDLDQVDAQLGEEKDEQEVRSVCVF
jgi:hypothetical protein